MFCFPVSSQSRGALPTETRAGGSWEALPPGSGLLLGPTSPTAGRRSVGRHRGPAGQSRPRAWAAPAAGAPSGRAEAQERRAGQARAWRPRRTWASRQVGASRPGPQPSRGGGAGGAGRAQRGPGRWEPVGPRTQPPRRGRRHRVPGMSLIRKKGFYKQDVNKTAWELPKTYVSPTHVGSGAYGAVW